MSALKSFSDGPFFGPTRWTQIDWEQRQRLRGKPLASWLHGFYASHAEPRALTAEPRDLFRSARRAAKTALNGHPGRADNVQLCPFTRLRRSATASVEPSKETFPTGW